MSGSDKFKIPPGVHVQLPRSAHSELIWSGGGRKQIQLL